jgi:hypothetical protein
MMFVSISDDFTNLRHVQDAKLVFKPECTISGYKSCEASTLIHWTQKDECECLGAFRLPSTRKRCKTRISGPNALYSDYQSCEASIRPKMMFGSVSEHFANAWLVKEEKLVFRARMQYFGVPKLWGIHSSPLDPKWCLWVFRMIS